MRQQRFSAFGIRTLFLLLLSASVPMAAQSSAREANDQDPSLADTVKQLQQQVQELRSVVADLRSDSER